VAFAGVVGNREERNVSTIERMVRITIEQMTEPEDVMLAQIETTHYLVIGDLTEQVLDSYAIIDGAHVAIPCSEPELQRYFKAQRAEV
jgi:hypothetical protein